MPARTIMVQGTASHAGKSILAAALCRIFYQDGYRVAPFKSQNMALNSCVTSSGGEMGRAQVVQAEAAGIKPEVIMNPVLLKPTGNSTSQVIILGRPLDNYSAQNYHNRLTKKLWSVVTKSLEKLRDDYDVVVIEGAGSPAEINLQDTEIVNMKVAREADAPVLLVADIDRGGALASVVGTLELLEPRDRKRIKGVIINKFRGDVTLFQPAVKFLEDKTGVPVYGIVPYFEDIHIQDEDSVVMESKIFKTTGNEGSEVDICVVKLPRISNFTDFDPFENDLDVNLRYARNVDELGSPDLLILPGSKNTIEDLVYLRKTGLADRIVQLAGEGARVVGICGGFQMLGVELADPEGTESEIEKVKGLGLLEMKTVFSRDKITSLVEALLNGNAVFSTEFDCSLTGYEIHMGRTELSDRLNHAFVLTSRSGQRVNIKEGAVSTNGRIWGTYIHGIFDNDTFRRQLIDAIKLSKGITVENSAWRISTYEKRQDDYDRLADIVRQNINMNMVYKLLGM